MKPMFGALPALLVLALMAGCDQSPPATTTPPPVANAPAPPVSAQKESNTAAAPTPAAAAGGELYQQHCQGCHGSQGQGVKNAGVSLVEESGEEEAELREVIQRGKGKMPAFKDKLSEGQITALIQHLRTFSKGTRAGGDDDH